MRRYMCRLLCAAAVAAAVAGTAAGAGAPGAGGPPRRLGRALRRLWGFAPGYVNLNHGSFGATPTQLREEQRRLTDEAEARPDVWFRWDYRERMREAREAVARFVGAAPSDVVLVENASGGANSFLRSLRLGAGTKVLLLSVEYGMVKNVLAMVAERDGAELVEVHVPEAAAASPAALLKVVADAIEAHGGAPAFSLAVVDHITSAPALVLPLLDFIDLVPGVPVMVDGAHAPGQIPVDLSLLRARHVNASARAPHRRGGAAAYYANFHKWMYTPKGSAFMWASPEFQPLLVPAVLSGCRGDFQCSFEYTGTRDYTAMLTMPGGIAFRASLGTEAELIAYGHDLAAWAGEHLSRVWGTHILQPPEMTGWMTNVRLPSDDEAVMAAVADRLLEEHDTFVVFFRWEGRMWTRLSAQLYLDREDFELFGERVLRLLREAAADRRRCGRPRCGAAGGPAARSAALRDASH